MPMHLKLKDLKKTEWSKLFETLMRNRMIQGAYRYGLLGSKDKLDYDRISNMIERLKLYKQNGNDELLVDVANICLCEFIEGRHPNKHFKSTDDGVHSKEKGKKDDTNSTFIRNSLLNKLPSGKD